MTTGKLNEELTVPMVYGQALLEAAAEDVDTDAGRQRLDAVRSDARELADLLHREPELARLISTPVISAKKRKDSIREIFGGRLAHELVNLMCVMVDKGRGASVLSVLDRFERLVLESEGGARGTIQSAKPLSEQEIEQFQQETGRLIRRKVLLVNEVVPELLGGVRILVEGKVLDASVRQRLEELAQRLA